MNRILLIVLGVVCLLGALIAALPLRLVFDMSLRPTGFQAEAVHGSVWNGQIYGLRRGQLYFDKVTMTLQPASLLGAQAEFDLRVDDPQIVVQGTMRAKMGSFAVENLRGAAELYRLPGFSEMGLPAGEALRLNIEEIRFDNTGCRAAQGQVSTTLLNFYGNRYNMDLPVLEGQLACVSEKLGISIEVEHNLMDLNGRVLLDQFGYDVNAEAQLHNVDIIPVLLVLEFEEMGDTWRYAVQGQY